MAELAFQLLCIARAKSLGFVGSNCAVFLAETALHVDYPPLVGTKCGGAGNGHFSPRSTRRMGAVCALCANKSH